MVLCVLYYAPTARMGVVEDADSRDGRCRALPARPCPGPRTSPDGQRRRARRQIFAGGGPDADDTAALAALGDRGPRIRELEAALGVRFRGIRVVEAADAAEADSGPRQTSAGPVRSLRARRRRPRPANGCQR